MVLCRMLQFKSKTMRRVHSLRRSWAVLRIRSSCASVTGIGGGAIKHDAGTLKAASGLSKHADPRRALGGDTKVQGAARPLCSHPEAQRGPVSGRAELCRFGQMVVPGSAP